MAKKPAKKIAVKKSSSAGKPAPIAKATPADGSDRQQLADVIRAQTGCTALAARETVKALLETLSASLKKNQKVQLVGFGTFTVAKRGARKGINPRTGESINIKASKSVRFKAGQALKKSL